MNNKLQEMMSPEDFKTIKKITEKSKENKFQAEKRRLKEKFEKLTRNKNVTTERTRQTKITHEVIDLTKDGIDEDVKAYLKLGPNFSETPKVLPYERIIIETEKMCKIIEKET